MVEEGKRKITRRKSRPEDARETVVVTIRGIFKKRLLPNFRFVTTARLNIRSQKPVTKSLFPVRSSANHGGHFTVTVVTNLKPFVVLNRRVAR